MNENKNIRFFPGLNALRFLAALSVIIGHVELIKIIMRFENHYFLFERINFGGLGVYFFFVLSGFLITYLLLKEKHKHHTIGIKNFYVRRILRIWPLYYLIVILGFFVLPKIDIIQLVPYQKSFVQHFSQNLILYLLFLPNLAFAFFQAVPHIGQSWSIGVEEQFYLFWPLLVKKSKNILKLIIWAFVVICIAKVIIFLLALMNEQVMWLQYIKKYAAMCKFESMMIGAFGALMLFEGKNKFLDFVYSPLVFYSSLLLFFPLNYLLFNNILQNGIHIPISFMFLVIILNIATNSNCRIRLQNRVLDYLGQISYGLYMYHLMIIPFVLYLFKRYFDFNGSGILLNSAVYLLSVLLTIAVSSLSYHYFEKYFTDLKKKYESK